MLTEYMCQEKKKEEDLPALKIALTHRYNNFNTTYKSANKHSLQPPETDQQNGNYQKTKMQRKTTQQNIRCRICGDRDETIYQIISEAANLQTDRQSIRLNTTGYARWSTWKCERNWNLTIRTNCIYTTQNPSAEWDARTPLGFWDTEGSLDLN